jgi:uncharacterized protein
MEDLLLKSAKKISQTSTHFKRYLYHHIDRNQRFVAIKGARGAGKTTLLIQIGKELMPQKSVLYIALDDLYFTNSTLYSLAENFHLKGGEVLLLDEVHKYQNWSRELKLIYDDFLDLKVIFTSSSILDIYKGESDLSRRVVNYVLKEMSYREFLILQKNILLPSYSLSEILANHSNIAIDLTQKFKPYQYFDEYLKYGAYPFYKNDAALYHQKLIQTISLILEIDLPSIENIDYNTIVKIKRLLFVLASNVPYTPNISKLSEQIGLTRNALIHVLQLMDKAFLTHSLYQQSKSISSLNKPDKIWLRNTNLMYALSKDNTNIGTVRETFVLQSISELHTISLPQNGDVFVDQLYTFEIGGKSKTNKQIAQTENAYLLKDNIEIGLNNMIPIWLFGFLY